MKRGLTVSTTLTKGLVAAAAARGIHVPTLLKKTGLTTEQLADREGTLPFTTHQSVWWQLTEMSGDGFLGLHLAESIPRGAFGLREYVIRSAPTLGAALAALVRYQRLMIGNVFQLVNDGDVVRIEHTPYHMQALPHHTTEFTMANLVLMLRGFSNAKKLPQEVFFRHPSPAVLDEHHRLFSCPVHFEQSVTAFTVDHAILAEPLSGADAPLHEVLVRQADAILERAESEPDLLTEVQQQVCTLLRGSKPALPDIARRLGMSSRSLQRRLNELGTSFQKLLDDTCREIALRQVREQRLTISEITFLLGYSEVSAFHHAFRRWTGVAPAHYRRVS
jgi:AraC-like DNA-binding protein